MLPTVWPLCCVAPQCTVPVPTACEHDLSWQKLGQSTDISVVLNGSNHRIIFYFFCTVWFFKNRLKVHDISNILNSFIILSTSEDVQCVFNSRGSVCRRIKPFRTDSSMFMHLLILCAWDLCSYQVYKSVMFANIQPFKRPTAGHDVCVCVYSPLRELQQVMMCVCVYSPLRELQQFMIWATDSRCWGGSCSI